MEPFEIAFTEPAAASVRVLPEAGRRAVMSYLRTIARAAGDQKLPALPIERMAEVASFFVRYVVDRQARCIRVVSPLE